MSRSVGIDTILKPVQDEVKKLNGLMIGLVIVLGLGFITLLITVAGLAFAYMHDSQDVYRQAQAEIQRQNDKIDTATNRLNDLVEVVKNEQKTLQKTN